MDLRKITEQFKENMPEFSGTEEEKEIKKALYLYIELGKIKSFDERYYYGSSETQRKIYALAKRQERNPNEVIKQRRIICVSLTHLYCNLLKEFGSRGTASPPDETGHIHPIITTKTGKNVNVDLQLDLEKIQTKSRLEHFDYIEDKEENQEAITKMLIEMGYIKDEKDYKDEAIKMLSMQVKGMKPHEALKTILQDEKLYEGNEDMEGVEISKFYIKTLKKIVPHFLNRKIYAFNCYREKENGEKDYTLCVFSEEDNIKIYLFSKKARRFLSVDTAKISELQKEGLVLNARAKEIGSNKLKKYIEREKRKEKSQSEL